jgi:hypothetical protein
MIRITCLTGSTMQLKVVDTETGVDITKYITDLKLHIKERKLYATIEMTKIELDVAAMIHALEKHEIEIKPNS